MLCRSTKRRCRCCARSAGDIPFGCSPTRGRPSGRARRMGNGEDGPPLCASRCGAPGRLCRQHGRPRHRYGTTSGFPRHSPITSCRKLMKLVVARDRIELPTRGFSVLHFLKPAAPRSTQNNLLRGNDLSVGDGGCSWVTLGWVPKWKPAAGREHLGTTGVLYESTRRPASIVPWRECAVRGVEYPRLGKCQGVATFSAQRARTEPRPIENHMGDCSARNRIRCRS